jgi:hypothetical protein
MSGLRPSEERELVAYRSMQMLPFNAKCDGCGQECHWPLDHKRYSFPQCLDCYEDALWTYVDYERGEA